MLSGVVEVVHLSCDRLKVSFFLSFHEKIRRGPKLEGYEFANFGYSSETDGESHHEMGN